MKPRNTLNTRNKDDKKGMRMGWRNVILEISVWSVYSVVDNK